MPGLIWPAVPNARFLHRRHPHRLPDRPIARPPFKRARVLEYLSIRKERVRLLRFQSLQRRPEQLHTSAPGGGLRCLRLPLACLCHRSTHHYFLTQPVDITPFKRHQFAGVQACPKGKLHHVPCLAGEGAEQRQTELTAEVGDVAGTVTDLESVVIIDREATAQAIQQIGVKIDDNSADIQTVSRAQADTDGKFSTMYSVKMQVNADGHQHLAG